MENGKQKYGRLLKEQNELFKFKCVLPRYVIRGLKRVGTTYPIYPILSYPTISYRAVLAYLNLNLLLPE